MTENINRLRPTYDLLPGGVAELYDGPVTVTVGAHKGPGLGRVWFDWERAVRVSASGDGQVALAMNDYQANWSVSLPGVGEVIIEELDSTATMPAAAWQLEAIAVADGGDLGAELLRVDFQIANFTVFFDGGGERTPWRLLLDDDRWRVTIDQLEDASDRLKVLKRRSGGAVLHAGRLERPNGSPFSWSEASEVLHGLQLLLAFAAGDRAPVLLPVGYDSDGNAVVHGLRSPRRESYQGRFRWCGPLIIQALTDVWPRFVDLWEDADTNRMWKLAGELYVEAQHGDNLETRLVDAQSLLEVIAWDRLVRLGGRDPDDVDGHSADWRIRKMLAEIGAPDEVPDTMPETRQQWPGADGPKVIAELRNSVVHPTDIQALLQLSPTAKHHVVRLAIWYADLALLSLLDYNGNHLNRTGTLPVFEGQGEPVPWATP
ncbi:MAG: hypothetical protein ABGZ36_16615 [Actinomycetota bacterium]